MRQACLGIACAAFLLAPAGFAAVVQAQTGQPSPVQAAAATPVLRAETRLVTVDVVVTDGLGNAVRGLSQQDFVVQENKSVQQINGFEEHGSVLAQPVKRAQTNPGLFTNRTVASPGGAVNVLLVDTLNTPATDQTYLRDQMTKFLAAQTSGMRFAVFAMTTQLHMLQDFTTDPALLRQAIKAQGVKFSPLLAGGQNDTAAYEASSMYSDLIANTSDPAMQQTLRGMQTGLLDMEAQRASQQTQTRARLTMDMLRGIARYLAGIPGRKNLLWFSGAFPLNIQRDVLTTGDPFAGAATLEPEFRKTVELLDRSQIAVYPIDSRGLQIPPSMRVGLDETASGNIQRDRDMRGSTALNPADAQFYLEQTQEHDTMRELAERTGGEAFYNTNGLFEATARAVRDGSQYYTLTYTPSAAAAKGFRRIDVKLASRKGLHLAYRRGYLVETPAANLPAAGAGAGPQRGADALQDLAVRTVPDSAEIAVTLLPAAAVDAVPARTVGGKLFGGTGTAYRLNLRVPDVKDVAFTLAADGKEHAVLEFVTLLFDGKGKLADSLQDRVVLALGPDQMQAVRTGGLRFHQDVVLPASSDLAVRMIVRDATTDRTGSVMVSADSVRKAADQSR